MVETRIRPDPVVRTERNLLTLFPPSPNARMTAGTVFLTLGALMLATLASIVRQSGVGALATLYAEDGTIFLRGAVTHHQGLAALPEPYMGYIHSLPRILAALAASMPLRWAAVILSGGSALVVAVVALLVFRASAGHLRSMPARALLAATLIFLPVATAEVLDNVANLHWFLMYAAFWVLLWRTDRAWEIAAGSTTVILAGASDPLTLLLAPVVVFRVLSLGGLRNHLFPTAWGVGLVAQAIGIVVSQAHRNLLPPIQVTKVVGWYLFDVLARSVFGTQLLGSPRSLHGIVLATLGILALGALAVIVIRAGLLRRQPLAGLAVAMSILYFAVPVVLTGISAPRYSVVPILLILTAVASLLDQPLPAATALWTGTRIAAVALVVFVWAVEFQVHDARSVSVRWADQLARAQAICAQTPSGEADIPIAPPGWDVDLACRDLVNR